jgi:hypothetical protein
MGKVTVLFILAAFVAVTLFVGAKAGFWCQPAIAACPSPYISTDTGHHAPADPDVQHITPVDG